MFEMTEPMADLARLQRTWMSNKDLDAVRRGYFESCASDLKDILVAAPGAHRHILDIGCGMAGVDILLSRELRHVCGRGHAPKFYLMDKNHVDEVIGYGYKSADKASAYCDFRTARAFAGLNGIRRNVFFFSESWPEQPVCFDLIFSLISCGFHYPLGAYLTQILDSLATGGRVILDIRKHSGQFEILHRVFDRVDTVRVEEKYKRVVCWNETKNHLGN
jgi:SAM-dependent methyltransferase